MKKDPIIFSYNFDNEGKASKIIHSEVAKELKDEGLAWVHLDLNNRNIKHWLETQLPYLDHLIIDALVADETRPRIIEFETGFLLIMRSVAFDNKLEDEMVSIRIWIDKLRIISIEKKSAKSIYDLKENLDQGKKIKDSNEFLYNLIYNILSSTSALIYSFTDELDKIEGNLIKTHDIKYREQITQIRTKSAIYKRYLIPQKEVIKKLQTSDQLWISKWAKRHFQENYDTLNRIIEEIEEAKERSQILHDELSNSLSEKLNKIIYKLSIITSIFMPLTFFTGIFGMNIKGLPGIDNPDAFNLSIATMLAIFMMQIYFFKKAKLFNSQ
jgi:zinc transporter